MKRRNHGFTLIEMLVVVVIIGILASTVVLGFVGSDREQNLRMNDVGRSRHDLASHGANDPQGCAHGGRDHEGKQEPAPMWRYSSCLS